jgi:uncharacterized protein (TIGR00730 family)
MSAIKSVAVFCGSRVGSDPAYAEAMRVLGSGLAKAGIKLIYGGGRIGLMGILADATVAAGGQVSGVIPDFLQQLEVAHQGLSELTITDTMHTRKAKMAELADAFLTMPGGLGTLDETIEIITWRQLKLHDKPILICDINGSAHPLLAAIEATVTMGFANPSARDLFEAVDGVVAVLARLTALPATQGGTSELV